jgi:surface protein
MFSGCTKLNSIDLSNFHTGTIKYFENMFDGCESLTSIDVTKFEGNEAVEMSYMFHNCKKLTSIDFANLATPNLLTFSNVFENCENLVTVKLPLLNIIMVNNFGGLFANCRKLTNLEFAPQSEATIPSILTNMFLNCESLEIIDLTHFRMDVLYSLESAFEGCTNLKEIKFEDFMNSEFLIDMSRTFKDCKKLTYINLTALHTNTIINMNEAFSGCESLEALDMPNVNTIILNEVSGLFKNNKKIAHLELNLFNTLNVKEPEKRSGMFENFNKAENITMIVEPNNIENIREQIPDNVLIVRPE